MGFGKKQQELARTLGKLEAANEGLKEQIRDRDSQIIRLNEQVLKLQESLLAVQAPESYKYLKDMEYVRDHPDEQTDIVNRMAEEQGILQTFAEAQEGPLFKDTNELYDLLSSFTKAAGPPEAEAPHDNEEG